MPQGGIDKGEDPLDAAWREMREETGVTSASLGRKRDWLRYDLPPELAARMRRPRYRGQRQKCSPSASPATRQRSLPSQTAIRNSR